MTRATSSQPECFPLQNAEVAALLEEVADLLEAQGANSFRVRAYRNGAQTIRGLAEPAAELLAREGGGGLMQLDGIGQSLARAIEQILKTGRLGLLDRLRGDAAPERILATVPGIGVKTASRIREELGIETLAQLESAAYDGRLRQLEGMGPKRLRGVRESLAGRFRRRRQDLDPRGARPDSLAPPVGELLSIDEEYRRKAEADRLPRIAPRRFNPTGQAWLPILHAHRDHRHYTAMYSNTARAHELGTSRDWVVIYRDDDEGHGQWTVVTAQFGPLKGRRIVRGREQECRQLLLPDEPTGAEAKSDRK